MKRLILFELIVLFLATTFESDSPPGWYQQVLPVNDIINDIFFIDTLNGWAVTDGNNFGSDTSFTFRTTNGGNNWNIQFAVTNKLKAMQFTDITTGYLVGGTGTGTGRVYKTTNSGNNWNLIFTSGVVYEDIFFINKDTGWISDPDATFGAGLQKTTNGGASWFQQLNRTFRPSKLFFINKDTGWVACSSTQLFRTTNGGTNWNLQFNFIPFDNVTRSIFFINSNTGWSTHYTPADTNGIYITTNGGFNWVTQRDPDPFSSGLGEVYFVNPSTGYIATGFSKILKTTNTGVNWNSQNGPNGAYTRIQFIDTSIGWASGNILIHTIDGGGTVGIQQIGTEIPSDFKLYQNYPNPFNPKTNIKYQITNNRTNVQLRIFDVTGREIITLVNAVQQAGTYEVEFSGNNYSSGVYFYSLTVDGKKIDTKKMLVLK